MKEFVCDACKNEINETDCMGTLSIRQSIYSSERDREHHFCNLSCLRDWLATKPLMLPKADG